MDERVGFFTSTSAAAPLHRAPKHAQVPATKAAPAPAGSVQARAAGSDSAAPGERPAPVGRMQTALATALKDDPDWKEF